MTGKEKREIIESILYEVEDALEDNLWHKTTDLEIRIIIGGSIRISVETSRFQNFKAHSPKLEANYGTTEE